MQNFFKGIIITFITEILIEITSFFVSVYRRQVLLLFKGLAFVIMIILGGLFCLLFGTNAPMPVIVIYAIIAYIAFKWLVKAQKIISLELEKNEKNEE